MRAIATVIACLMLVAPLAAQEAPVAGDETYAVVEIAPGVAGVRQLAEKHCAKYGRFAYFRHMDGPRAVFDCTVEKREPKKPVYSGRGIY
jgi:hypothetical protein